MANVLNRESKEYLKSVNTPAYPITDWIINPVLPDCDKKYWVIEGDNVREMNTTEKKHLEYTAHSTIYLIAEKQLLKDQNGTDYKNNINAIINPIMPDCELKYIKVENGKVVEMTDDEKKQVEYPKLITVWKDNISSEIRKTYLVDEEIGMIREVVTGKIELTDQKIIDWGNCVNSAITKFEKPE